MPDKMSDDRERKQELRDIIKQYHARETANTTRTHTRRGSDPGTNIVGIILNAALAIGAIAAMGFFAVAILLETGVFAPKTYWAAGERREGDYKINECIGRLWSIRAAIDKYYGINRKFPVSLDEIYRLGLAPERLVCPVTGREYLMQKTVEGSVVRCPNPEKHGVASLWVDVKGGPPVVER